MKGSHYPARVEQLEVEAAALQHELEHGPEDQRGLIRARLASVLRSLQWYRTRAGGQTLGARKALRSA